MHFHLPKPLHGWRALLSEIGVIVIGICIALIGEHFAEKVHEHIIVEEAREQINQEFAIDAAILGNRSREEQCIHARFEALARVLSLAGTAAYVAPSWVGAPSFWDNQTGRWQAASQSGRAALLSSREQFRYSFISSEIAALQLAQADEPKQWAHLQALEGVAQPSPQLVDSARLALIEARNDDRTVRSRISGLTDALRELGVAPVRSPITVPLSEFPVCWPITLKTEEGERRSD